MKQETKYLMVQGQTGYTFRNPDLLQQAFTRRSYSEENGGENNEVLEFIGDKALDLAVVQLLIREFGEMKDGSDAVPRKTAANSVYPNGWPQSGSSGGSREFACASDEGELTKIKSRMVSKHYLARRMDELGFAPYIRMGRGDQKNGVGDQPSVKEDLFEAIVGAVTLDCGWDLTVISSVVEAMLDLGDFFSKDGDDNYVRLIQEWEQDVNHALPWFRFQEGHRDAAVYYRSVVTTEFGAIYQTPLSYWENANYFCDLKLLDSLPVFRGWGASKSEARMNVCRLAWEYLKKNGHIRYATMRDEIGEPTKESAINQLEILARRGYFSVPTYAFEETHDSDGNPIWESECRIGEYERTFRASASEKKEAKKRAALQMLNYVLEEDERHGKVVL